MEGLSDCLNCDLKVEFKLGDKIVSPGGQAALKNGSIRQKENELAREPAVKTIITELGATITGIDEQDA